MSRDSDREISGLLAQLRDLHLQQAVLVDRFLHLTNRVEINEIPTRGTTNSTTKSRTSDRPFRVGDKVKINNPKFMQFDRGTVSKIGAVQITVTSNAGKTLTRLPKNLTPLSPATSTPNS